MPVQRGVQLTSQDGKKSYFIPDAELEKYKESKAAAAEFKTGVHLAAYEGTHPAGGVWVRHATVGVVR